MRYTNIAGRFFGLVTKHACDRRTDRLTDRQNYDSQDRASIAASRGKNRTSLVRLGVDLLYNKLYNTIHNNPIQLIESCTTSPQTNPQQIDSLRQIHEMSTCRHVEMLYKSTPTTSLQKSATNRTAVQQHSTKSYSLLYNKSTTHRTSGVLVYGQNSTCIRADTVSKRTR